MIGGGGGRNFPIPRSSKMSSPSSLEAKAKQEATDDDVLAIGDPEDATNSESSFGSSSNSVSDPGSGSDPESEPGAEPEAGTKGELPISRNDLLAYLENMRLRFLKKPTVDSFADQEEVLVVTSKKT